MSDQPTKIKMQTAIGIDLSGKPIFEEREYVLNSEFPLAGWGRPMAFDFLKEQILKHNQQKVDLFNAETDAEKKENLGKENVAITLGKESLMAILSQKGCEGIRFYFCENPWGRSSVAAVGVRSAVVNGVEVAQDIGVEDEDNRVSILNNASGGEVINSEVGPPNTVGELFKESDESNPFIDDIKGLFK